MLQPSSRVNRHGSRLYLILLFIGLSIFGGHPLAAAPDTVNIQGSVLDSEGIPLTGTRAWQIRFYDEETDGNEIGTTPPSFSPMTGSVTLSNRGFFSIPFELPQAALDSAQLWYELGIDTDSPPDNDASNNVFAGRSRVHSVPFALQAGELLGTVTDAQVPDDITVQQTQTALTADMATTASFAETAGHATTADSATFADFALNAGNTLWMEVLANPIEMPDDLNNDTWTANDVIIQGSLGVGYDILPSYDWRFDTFVLTENNVRILFRDTSSSAQFPSVDWRIGINDTRNGGEDYFRIEDVTNHTRPFHVGANAPDGSLYVQQTDGHVGVGTAFPQGPFEVHLASAAIPDASQLVKDQMTNGPGVAQSFTALASGFLKQVTINIQQADNETQNTLMLQIYSGSDPDSGVLLATVQLDYGLSPLGNLPAFPSDVVFDLSFRNPPIALVAGSSYVLVIHSNTPNIPGLSGFSVGSSGDVYAGGKALRNDTPAFSEMPWDSLPAVDLFFSTTIETLVQSASNTALLVDGNGRVGIGTNTPQRPLHINDILRLEPRNQVPADPSEGDVYVNSTDHHIYCYVAGVWKQLDN